MQFSRRDMLKLIPGSLLASSSALANPNGERKFLFVFCDGGWDSSFVFAPMFDNPNIDVDNTSYTWPIHDMSLVESEFRPSVRSFFENYGQDTVIINGIDLETVSHERGKQILMTGQPYGLDDWGCRIAAASLDNWAPHLVISGPTYSTLYPNEVMRIGLQGQLDYLIEADRLGMEAANKSAENAVNAYLQRRAAARVDSNAHAHMRSFAEKFRRTQIQIEELYTYRGELDFTFDNYTGTYGFCGDHFMARAGVALDCFERGLARCAMVEDYGWCGWRWDTHYDMFEQNYHFELLFQGLNLLMEELHTRRASSGAVLADEVTVVVLSEMGRHPKLNYIGGKDHWPVTSAMLIGGVDGGRTVGGFTDMMTSAKVDLTSGDLYAGGDKIRATNFGATLLALANADPSIFTDATPITGIIR